MRAYPELVDVSELAAAAGLRLRSSDLDPQEAHTPAPGRSPWIPVYVTRLLWERLGGDSLDTEPYLSRAQNIFQKADLASQARMIEQRGWRAGFSVELDGAPVTLWIIHGHSYSDGIAIGYGPGDFWPDPARA
jgi:hypothetical protein